MENLFQITMLVNILISSFFVLSSKNPVHSVLFLILVFLSSSGLLLYFGAEFIALIFIIVYVGAIAVLFLFIVMMLNIKIKETSFLLQYAPFAFFFGILLLMELYLSIDLSFFVPKINTAQPKWILLIDPITNLEVIGQVLYHEFLICFVLCGVLLLIAMLGAIVLTQKFNAKRSNELVSKQLSRNDSSFFLLK